MAAPKNEKIFKTLSIAIIFVIIVGITTHNFSSFKKAFINIFKKEKIVSEINTEIYNQDKKTENFLNEENQKNKSSVLIAEVFLGESDSSSFIKIFNFSNEEKDLSEYSIRKINSSSQTTLVSKKRFSNISIKPFSYITISKENGGVNSQINWPKSYSLNKTTGITLYRNNQKEDEVVWNKNLKNITLKRINWEEDLFAYLYFN